MGEGTNGVRPSPEELERDVERIRDSMAGIVSELDRRRHELFDWRLQLRRHKLGIGLLAGGVVLLLGTAMVVKAVKSRRRAQPMVKVRNLGRALARMMDTPEEVAKPKPNVVNKALSSLLTTAIGMIGKMAIRRLTPPEPSERSTFA